MACGAYTRAKSLYIRWEKNTLRVWCIVVGVCDKNEAREKKSVNHTGVSHTPSVPLPRAASVIRCPTCAALLVCISHTPQRYPRPPPAHS